MIRATIITMLLVSIGCRNTQPTPWASINKAIVASGPIWSHCFTLSWHDSKAISSDSPATIKDTDVIGTSRHYGTAENVCLNVRLAVLHCSPPGTYDVLAIIATPSGKSNSGAYLMRLTCNPECSIIKVDTVWVV